MRSTKGFAVAGLAVAVWAGSAVAMGSAHEAAAAGKAGAKGGGTCLNKAASGTNTTVDGAKFQAWEAVLQATDWGMWSTFMASGAGIGTAPGYKVSNVKSSCAKGGIGYSCKMQATLCR